MTLAEQTRFWCNEVPEPLDSVAFFTLIQNLHTRGIIRRADSVMTRINLIDLSPGTELQADVVPPDIIPSDVMDWNIESISAEVLRLDRCINELRQWLGLGLLQVTKASGISRSTVYAWRLRGSEPRPSTISSISNFHFLVKAMVSKEGIESTREYFHSGSPTVLDELIGAVDDSSRARVLSKLRRRLIVREVPPPNPFLAVMPRNSSGYTDTH